ncbi:MAG: tetratricopeptide repeat protein, partial [Candidatus Binatia bacterium]
MSRLARGWVVTTIVTVAASRALAVSGAADVYVARAIVAYEDKRYDDALRELDEALELEPENVEAHFYSGLVRIALGELGDAAAALERARSLSPEDPAILYQLGVVNVRRKRDDLARPLLEDAFRLKPSLDGLGYHLGVVRYRAGEYQAALEAFEASVSADRDIEQLTRFYAGLASLRLGLAERATHEVEEALRLRPASPLTGPAERLRELALAARGREGRPVERRVRLELRVGGFYDDNVSVQPETSDDPVARSLRQGDRDSPGAITALRAAGLLLRRGALEATGSYSFFSTSNVDLPEFDIIDNLLE